MLIGPDYSVHYNQACCVSMYVYFLKIIVTRILRTDTIQPTHTPFLLKYSSNVHVLLDGRIFLYNSNQLPPNDLRMGTDVVPIADVYRGIGMVQGI